MLKREGQERKLKKTEGLAQYCCLVLSIGRLWQYIALISAGRWRSEAKASLLYTESSRPAFLQEDLGSIYFS